MERTLARMESGSTGSGSDAPLPEDLVTCPITFELYQIANEEEGDDYVPMDPPCRHTLSKIALKDILAQPNLEKWLCPMCQEQLPSNDINFYKPNRFALGVLEAMEVARKRTSIIRKIPRGWSGSAAGGASAEALPDGWDQICTEFDVQELGGELQRFQAQQDVVARHRNGLVSAGILSVNGRDTRVAVKLVLPTDAGNADGSAARREVAALAQATRQVPAAVLQLRGFVHAGSFLIAQEMPGTSLIKHVEKVMNEQGGLKASTWLELMLQLIDCLRQLHGCGVIHCDISPASVSRSATGTLKLTDFSSACLGAPPEDGSTLLAAPAATFSSKRVAYLAPEQLVQVPAMRQQAAAQQGGAPGPRAMPGTVTDRTDVWAFAMLALHLWTGTPPTRGITPDCSASTLPDLLRDLFMGCLHPSPAQRPEARDIYDTLCMVTELKDGIEQFAEETEICVGVPPQAMQPQRGSHASMTRSRSGYAASVPLVAATATAAVAPGGRPSRRPLGPLAAGPRAAAPAVMAPAATAQPTSTRPTQVAAAPLVVAEEPSNPPLTPFQQAQADLEIARLDALAQQPNDAVGHQGIFGRVRQLMRAHSGAG